VYDDDYEEPVEGMESDGFGGIRVKQPVESHLSRESTYTDALPLAKCADCGDSLPFDELVGHSCINLSDCKSPLFSQPPTPMLEGTEGPRSGNRSPFLEKYSQVVESSSSPYFGQQLRSATSPPLGTPESSSHQFPRRSNTTPVPPPDSDKRNANRIEQLRMERIKQIEEQRAAKKMQASKGDLSPRPNLRNEPKDDQSLPFATHTHTLVRQPGSLSSSSMSSGKSRKSSLFDSPQYLTSQTPSSIDNLTPSSSFEQFESEGEAEKTKKEDSTPKASKQRVNRVMAAASNVKKPKKKPTLDLGGIEDLLHDINTEDAPRGNHPVHSKESSTKPSRRGPRPPELKLPTTIVRPPKVKKTCHVCMKTFAKNQPMAEKDGKIFCIDDYAELYLEKCRKCCRPVRDVGVRSKDGALSGIYHRDCLSCFRCNAAFVDQTFYVFDNAPYCGKHYHQLNGSTCHSCKEGIEGKCRQLETGERFHSRCLTCQYDNGKEFCKDILTDYYLIKNKRLCEWHYERLQAQLVEKGNNAKAAQLKASKRRTFIKTVEARKGKA